MNTYKTETLYKKVGRKYVPVEAAWEVTGYPKERMPVCTFRLVYAYADGGRRYEYDVTPTTAPVAAAMLLAKSAMIDKITEQYKMRPAAPTKPWTKRQKALIEKFREDMGGMLPSTWAPSTPHEIADAAMRAVMDFKP